MAVNTEERHGQESLENHKHMFNQGVNYELYNFLGVHKISKDDESGYVFRVWAPHAKQVWVCGDFNNWDKSHPMILDEKSGIWSIEVKESRENQYYKYLVKQANGREIMKTDPMAQVYEKRPETAAVVKELEPFKWNDGLWRGRQKRMNYFNNPINIYEVHAPSWKEHEDGSLYTFKDLTVELIPYVKKMGYTHIEFMPLMEHPLPASWGYQLTGYFALCSSYGTPDEFKDFVNECHQNNIGVLVDWVPGHFSINDDALAYYDGTPTYEYEDPDRAKNMGWGALNFDLGKPEVQSFLLSSAFYWLNEFHLDGMRVDAVSNMIYLDYKVIQAFRILFNLPGVPCIYYGDEVGVEGDADPDNRRFFPWGQEKSSRIIQEVKKLVDRRKKNILLQEGRLGFVIARGSHCPALAIVRYDDQGNSVYNWLNLTQYKQIISPENCEYLCLPQNIQQKFQHELTLDSWEYKVI